MRDLHVLVPPAEPSTRLTETDRLPVERVVVQMRIVAQQVIKRAREGLVLLLAQSRDVKRERALHWWARRTSNALHPRPSFSASAAHDISARHVLIDRSVRTSALRSLTESHPRLVCSVLGVVNGQRQLVYRPERVGREGLDPWHALAVV